MRILLVTLVVSLVSHCTHQEQGYTVVTSTSMIGTIVQEIGKERVEVITVVPAGMCPGQFDLKPGDVKAAANARLVLMHGWEQWMGDLMHSTGEKGSAVRSVPVEGAWMIPSVHLEAVDWIAKALANMDSKGGAHFYENALEYKKYVMDNARRLEKRATVFADIPVVSNQHQSEFLEWLGFNVVSTFASHWDAAPEELVEIVRKTRTEDVRLVVDNLQDQTKVGNVIAKAVDGAHVVLTNFPVKGSYVDALNDNVDKLSEAIHLSKGQE